MAGSDEWRCVAATVPPGRTATFRLQRAGRTVHGFVVNHEGHYRAYVNSCPHVGTPLDLWPNEFYTEDGLAFTPSDEHPAAGGDLAWVTCTENIFSEVQGRLAVTSVLATNVFEHGADGWRMVHHHASHVLSGRPAADAPETLN